MKHEIRKRHLFRISKHFVIRSCFRILPLNILPKNTKKLLTEAYFMDDQVFQNRLLKLLEENKQLAELKGLTMYSEMGEKCEDLLKSFKMLQETLDTLRLNIKYLQFDLETTKKENIALRKKLEERES
jgi:hypothetical protein